MIDYVLIAMALMARHQRPAGADTSAIVAEKQRLRDITKLADSAGTLDELRNLHAQ